MPHVIVKLWPGESEQQKNRLAEANQQARDQKRMVLAILRPITERALAAGCKVELIWRQKDREAAGAFARYEVLDASRDMSFLELLDVINERLIASGGEPIAFDSDCREGICGSCGMMINGVAHGPMRATAACQLYLRLVYSTTSERNISLPQC